MYTIPVNLTSGGHHPCGLHRGVHSAAYFPMLCKSSQTRIRSPAASQIALAGLLSRGQNSLQSGCHVGASPLFDAPRGRSGGKALGFPAEGTARWVCFMSFVLSSLLFFLLLLTVYVFIVWIKWWCSVYYFLRSIFGLIANLKYTRRFMLSVIFLYSIFFVVLTDINFDDIFSSVIRVSLAIRLPVSRRLH